MLVEYIDDDSFLYLYVYERFGEEDKVG